MSAADEPVKTLPESADPDAKSEVAEEPVVESDKLAETTSDAVSTPADAPKKKKKSKKSKKQSLRAKYDALVENPDGDEDKPEPKVEGDVGDESDNTENGNAEEEEDGEFIDEGSEEDDDLDDDDDDDEENDDDDNDEVDEVEIEEVDELSEPEVELGSRRRRAPVDYTKVLAELEAEERAQKKQKTEE